MSRCSLYLAVVLTTVLYTRGNAMAQTKPRAEFVGHTYAHEWTEGAFKGAAFEMDYLSDHEVRWTGTAGAPKGNSAVEKYQYVHLAPKVHQFSFVETGNRTKGDPPAGFFAVLTYDLEKDVIHGLISDRGEILVLKGNFKRVAKLAPTAAPSTAADFKLICPDVKDGKLDSKHMLDRFGCNGGNVSPALSWQGVPAGTKSFVLMVHDRDAATGIGWMHWVVVNIPADATGLPQGMPLDGKGLPLQTRTDFGGRGYGGPCPPPGQQNRYVFTLYALKIDKLPDVDANATPALVALKARENSLGTATLTVKQGR